MYRWETDRRRREREEGGGSVTPRSHGYGDVTATYIRRAEIPYVYTLSISTGKNQSRKHSDNIHSSNNNTTTQLSQSKIQYLKNIRSSRSKSKMYNIKDGKVLTSRKMRISRVDQGEAERKRVWTGNR